MVAKAFGDTTFTITPTGGSGAGLITYESSDLTVATVSATSGEVTIVSDGTTTITTITAIKAADASYNAATASYTLSVKANQAAFTFANPAVDKTVGDPVFTFTPTGGSGAGGITYLSTNSGVATIDADNGEVTIAGDGTTTITATKAADDNYNVATASYTLIVTATPAPPTFGSAIIADQDYTVRHAVNFTLPAATGGTTPLSYSLTPGGSIPAGLSFNADDLVLVGTLTTAAAAITLTYTVTDSTTPTPATAFQTFTVTVAKGEQAGFSFATATVNRIVGQPGLYRGC